LTVPIAFALQSFIAIAHTKSPASAATNVPSEPGVNSVPAVTVALIAAIPTANI